MNDVMSASASNTADTSKAYSLIKLADNTLSSSRKSSFKYARPLEMSEMLKMMAKSDRNVITAEPTTARPDARQTELLTHRSKAWLSSSSR